MEAIDDSILVALGTRADRLFLFTLEDEFKQFVNTAKSDECIVFPTMTSYHRLLIHKVTEMYGLYSESNGWGAERQTTVATTPRANLDFIIYEGKPPEKVTKKAKLDITEATPNNTIEATSSAPTIPSTDTPSTNTSVTPINQSTNLPIETTSLTNTNTTATPTHTNEQSSTQPVPTTTPTETTTTTSTTLPTTSTTPTTTSTPTPTNTETTTSTKPTRTRKPPKNPQDNNGPRVMRGRGSSKFQTQADDFATEEEVSKEEREDRREGAEEGEIKGEEEPVATSEGKLDGVDEEGLPTHKQLPLLNDYSQFEYGNPTSKTKSTNTYGFASHEHIIRVVTDLDSKPSVTIEQMLANNTKQRFTLKSKDNVSYAIFRSVEAAQSVLSQLNQTPLEYHLSLLTLTSTPKKEEFPDEALYPRPETTVRVARRLIGNALDMANLQRSTK